MKTLNAISLAIVVLLGAMASTPVFAGGGKGHQFRSHQISNHHFRHHHFRHHSRAHVGVFIGAPLLFAPWYYPPYYYYPPAVVVPASPPVYIEQGQVAPADQPYWYYCRESETYYPYVKECAGPWQRVVPQPPPS